MMPRRSKKYFDTRKEAKQVAQFRGEDWYKVKHGRHKGEYFVGSWIEIESLKDKSLNQ